MITESSHSQDLLPVLRNEQYYHCPGQPLPVTRAVHLARLASGWDGCDSCVRRHESDELRRPDETASYRSQIRRTRNGVRGSYLNAVSRGSAARLATIMSSFLIRESSRSTRDIPSDDIDHETVFEVPQAVSLVVGFDERRGSPDVFAGVRSAVLQNGCSIIDAGRCTAASLLNVCRDRPDAVGALFVTGSGSGPHDSGLDVFSSDGQTIAVPWQDYGVTVRVLRHNDGTDPAESDLSHPMRRALNEIRRSDAQDGEPSSSPDQDCVTLILPSESEFGHTMFRVSRNSGSAQVVDSESLYRRWLLRWWPAKSDLPVVFEVGNRLTESRLWWLAKECELNIEVRTAADGDDSGRPSDGGVSDRRPVIAIREDDRLLSVSRGKQTISAQVLADRMNRSVRDSASHVTAHCGPEDDQVVLVDVAGPDRSESHDVITDALAASGFLLNLLRNGNSVLS